MDGSLEQDDQSIVQLVKCVLSNNPGLDSKPYRSLDTILSRYVGNSFLLDPFMEKYMDLVQPGLLVLDKHALWVLYLFSRTVGYKRVARYLSSDASMGHKVVEFVLETRDWQTRTPALILLLNWFKVPFRICRILGQNSQSMGQLVERLKESMVLGGVEQHISATLLAILHKRPDNAQLSMDFGAVRHWICQILEQSIGLAVGIGILRFLVGIFKRNQAYPHKTVLFIDKVRSRVYGEFLTSGLVRKLNVRLSFKQWMAGLGNHHIQVVVDSLGDKDIQIRFKASMLLEQASENMDHGTFEKIINKIHSFLTERSGFSSEQDIAWKHGCCILLAHLIRKQRLPSDLIEQVFVPLVVAAMFYETRMGLVVRGHCVREAACFCVWSMARNSTLLKDQSQLEDISIRLIMVALMDRELNCRRAAAAALQELAGRKPFSNAAQLVTMVNFYSVSLLRHSFNLVIELCLFSEYRQMLIEFLINHASISSHEKVRQLTAETLRKLHADHHERYESHTKSGLVEKLLSSDTRIIQGALSSLASIVEAGWGGTTELARYIELVVSRTSVDSEKWLVSGILDWIDRTSDSVFSRFYGQLGSVYWKFVKETVGWSKEQGVVEHCCLVTGPILIKCFGCPLGNPDIESLRIQPNWILGLTLFSSPTLWAQLEILDNLFCELIQSIGEQQVESRRAAIQSYGIILTRLNRHELNVSSQLDKYTEMVTNYGLDDYSINSHGDVGSQVRKVSIDSLAPWIISGAMAPDVECLAVGKLVRISMETIETLRQLAQQVLVAIRQYKDYMQFEICVEDSLEVWTRKMTVLLDHDSFRLHILQGLCQRLRSCGEVATAKHLIPILECARTRNTEQLSKWIETLVDLWKNLPKLSTAVPRMTSALGSCRIFDQVFSCHPIASELCRLAILACKNSSKTSQVDPCIELLVQMAMAGHKAQTMEALLVLLQTSVPAIRKLVAEHLYVYGLWESHGEIQSRLLETCWTRTDVSFSDHVSSLRALIFGCEHANTNQKMEPSRALALECSR